MPFAVPIPNGDWWAVFLGTRPYGNDLYNTGRETFLRPVPPRVRSAFPSAASHQQEGRADHEKRHGQARIGQLGLPEVASAA
jgi:beta-xylosidase